ncbi:MAG TPA: carboxylating.nicotinate-nucleotide diphosphorylase, partial [Chloroflexota bacterium]|nr:carboxylating.nicotinate-nucleotide diphosphorylase [Chloroflexota bacterium]
MAAALEQWLAEDLGAGDATSLAVIDECDCTATIRGGPGTLSGGRVAELLFAQSGVRCELAFADGDALPADAGVARLAG